MACDRQRHGDAVVSDGEAEILPEIREIGFEQLNLPRGSEPTLREQAISGEIASSIDAWLPSTDLCLLIVWCVLCGFSEKMIPAALSQNDRTSQPENVEG